MSQTAAGAFAVSEGVAGSGAAAVPGVLRAVRPDDAVTGEESGATGAAGAGRRWLVDPLCGTLNYAVGNMLVAVNVALCEAAGCVVTGIDGLPVDRGAGGLVVAADRETHGVLSGLAGARTPARG
ncbi:inositol monophosphatase family protein [Streptomyces sp. DT224]|uniref:inositol monophosphatase family protein n=1 Tax=Streptomyces sp. DT224 TaxID=3393426 RepID=UPI003CEE40DD